MSESVSNAYDAVDYPGFPLPQTHPDRLSVLATLFGLDPAPVERCRVLELGCGEGGNLIPMAWQLPESRFTGVDLAARPIAAGQAMAASLGLRNIELRQLDICEIGPEWGQFDYIIAHGLYSWVPAIIQDKLLEICRANLAPRGVAYVSYNTYPGAHSRQMMREMMLFHAGGAVEPEQKIARALDLVSLLAEGAAGHEGRSPALKREIELVQAYRDHALLYHDDMAESNSPVYFHQFAEHAVRHGLQFLAEADFFEMQDHIYPATVRDKLRGLAADGVVTKEQYLDFIKCRRFRQTLLCHRERPLCREIGAERILGFTVASQARPVFSEPVLDASTLETFRGPNGAAMQTDHALAKAAICCLGDAWPRPMPFGELAARAYARLGRTPETTDVARDPEAMTLARILLGTYSAGLVEFHGYAPDCVVAAGERPKVSPLARWQAAHGHALLTSLCHTTVKVEDQMGAALILLLDGTRDRAALARDLADAALSGRAVAAAEDGEPLTRKEVTERIARDLASRLAALGRSGLLVR